MTHRLASSFRVVAIAVLAAALDASVRARSPEDLEQHVALTIELLELSVAEWKERVAVLAGDNGEARAAALAAIEEKYKGERTQVFEHYATSDSAHLRFFATYATEVDSYFEEHPEVKQRIDILSQTVRTLVAQAESPGGSGASR